MSCFSVGVDEEVEGLSHGGVRSVSIRSQRARSSVSLYICQQG